MGVNSGTWGEVWMEKQGDKCPTEDIDLCSGGCGSQQYPRSEGQTCGLEDPLAAGGG